MTQRTRIFLAIVLVLLLVGIVLGVDAILRRRAAMQAPADLPPGSIPIFADGAFAASFLPDDLAQLSEVSFIDAEEGKTQSGWMLADVLALHLSTGTFAPETEITVSSRDKSITLTWAEVSDPANMVIFDLAGRGTLKLVSLLDQLDVRDEWVQDVEKIEVVAP